MQAYQATGFRKPYAVNDSRLFLITVAKTMLTFFKNKKSQTFSFLSYEEGTNGLIIKISQ